MNVIFYNHEGRVSRVSYIQPECLGEGLMPGESYRVLEGVVPPQPGEVYVNVYTGEVVQRPVMGLEYDSLSVAVDEPLTITGIPVGTRAVYPGGEVIVDDGFIEWSSAVPGPFTFYFENFPYREETLRAQVG